MKKVSTIIPFICLTFLGMQAQAKNSLNFPSTKNIVADTNNLIEYKGKYLFSTEAPVSEVVLTIDKNGLVATSSDGYYVLTAVLGKADNFIIAELGAEVIFNRDEKKKIINFKLKLENGEFIGTKEGSK